MAAGRVLTGFSMPFVAKYGTGSTGVTYSNGMELARGVDVSIAANASSDNSFYANNTEAETSAGKFSGGTLTLTVDGLKTAAAQLIYGLSAPDTSTGEVVYDDDMAPPDVGVGFVARYQEDGVITYDAIIIKRVRFALADFSAATQEADISWQTESLTGTISRADDAKHSWQSRFPGLATEAAAVAKIKTALSIT